MGSEAAGIVGTEVGEHGAPYLRLDVSVGLVELHLVYKASLEGTVEVAGKVSGGDENAVEVFHLLQDDVLHGIVHLLDGGVITTESGAFAEDGIGLVEEEDGRDGTTLTQGTIAGKHLLDVLLALPHPLVSQSGNIDLHEVATRPTCNLPA